MESLLIGLLGTIACLCQISAFAWDDFNVERLFRNSDEVFSGLEVEVEEETCVQNFKDFVDQAKRHDKWALEVLDSWAKEPSGLRSGVSMDFGHLDQCLSASRSFPNQQCALQVESQRNVSYKMAICVPDSCSKSTLMKILGPFYKNADIEARQIFFCSNGKSPPWGVLQWSTLLLCLALLLLSLGGTAHELLGGHGLLLAFSLCKNTNKLFEQRDSFGSTQCINGLKVLSMTWIVYMHALQVIEFHYSLLNPGSMKAFHTTFFRSLLYVGGEYAVDVFFVIAAFLLTSSFLRDREKRKSFNVFKYVLHRYLRVMPVFAIIMLFFVALGPYFEDNPAEENFSGKYVDECRRHWWSALLLLQTYTNPTETCIYSSWYISTDFHLYLLSPLLLFPLAKFGKKFLAVLCLVILASLVYIVIGTYFGAWHFQNTYDVNYWAVLYFPAEVRVTPWVVGMMLGYLLFSTQKKDLRISRTTNLTLWLATFLVLAASFIIPWVAMQEPAEDVIAFSLFVPIQRLLWSLAFMWIIFACVKGYGGPVNWLLSFPFFQPLTKLSYSIYIGHIPLLIFIASTQRSLYYLNQYLVIHYFLGVFALTLILVVPIVLMVEMPVASFEVGVYKVLDERKGKVGVVK